ncbi:MAG: hypothetical protein LBF59_03095 [Prevotellaceae bacterium]|jgi:hypothetical protein|nr:hypothetical protein [Prevotellaceae bacterium]
MNTIIQFLQDDNTTQEKIKKINALDKDIKNINQLFNNQNIAQSRHVKLRPKIQPNQIWLVKNEYLDFLGNTQKTNHPFLVLITGDIDEIDEEEYVRTLIVSPFIEMAAKQDEICNDSSITGFPFLVETWNEQPVLTEILDEYVGYYEVKQAFSSYETLTSVQQEFREVEISRAKYLNHSIIALLSFMDNTTNKEFSAIISFSGTTQFLYYPQESLYTDIHAIHESEHEYLSVNKSGVKQQNKHISYYNKTLPFDIYIEKNVDGFVLTVFTTDNVELFDSKNVKINGLSRHEQIVFSPLTKGLYTINSKQIQKPVTIRLK